MDVDVPDFLNAPHHVGPATGIQPGAENIAADAFSVEVAELAGFSVPRQVKTKWCWAAVSVGIAKYKMPNAPFNQYAIATSSLRDQGRIGASDTCLASDPGQPSPDPEHDPCNQTMYLTTPLRLLGVLKKTEDKSIRFTDLAAEIKERRPVACHVRWEHAEDFPGHFIVIGGYEVSDAGNKVTIHDPDETFRGRGTSRVIAYSELWQYSERFGKWDYTYLVDYSSGPRLPSAQ